jgi:hypothetical protein
MEPQGSLSCSQQPSICPYPEPLNPSFVSTIYLNITSQATVGSHQAYSLATILIYIKLNLVSCATDICQLLGNSCVVRLAIFTAVTMKNALFWDVTSCGSCKSRRFGGAYHFHNESERLGVPLVLSEDIPHDGRQREPLATVSPLSCLSPVETSALTKTAWRRYIPENSILHCFCRENIKSFIVVLHGRVNITFE